MMRISWHGGPSFSLDLEGLEVLVDPAFSRVSDYPPWFNDSCVNVNSPTVDQYLEHYRPEYLFLTHGHFDHFDFVTVKRLASALDFRIIGTPQVLRTCREILGLPERRLLSCPAVPASPTGGPADARHPESGWLILRDNEATGPGAGAGVGPGGEAGAGPGGRPAVRVRAVPGPHWFTGDDADDIAAAFALRPERYGAMPCGGPMFGYLFEVGSKTVYISGDTEAPGHPAGPFDIAVVSCGGEMINPATQEREGPFLGEAALARAACEVMRPQVLIPVHYDHPVFLTLISPERIRAEMEAYPHRPELLVPPHNAWSPLPA